MRNREHCEFQPRIVSGYGNKLRYPAPRECVVEERARRFERSIQGTVNKNLDLLETGVDYGDFEEIYTNFHFNSGRREVIRSIQKLGGLACTDVDTGEILAVGNIDTVPEDLLADPYVAWLDMSLLIDNSHAAEMAGGRPTSLTLDISAPVDLSTGLAAKFSEVVGPRAFIVIDMTVREYNQQPDVVPNT